MFIKETVVLLVLLCTYALAQYQHESGQYQQGNHQQDEYGQHGASGHHQQEEYGHNGQSEQHGHQEQHSDHQLDSQNGGKKFELALEIPEDQLVRLAKLLDELKGKTLEGSNRRMIGTGATRRLVDKALRRIAEQAVQESLKKS